MVTSKFIEISGIMLKVLMDKNSDEPLTSKTVKVSRAFVEWFLSSIY
jgi:hypothetical protein